MLTRASELSSEQKIALESLLGRAISENETVSVRAFAPTPLSDARRREILAALDAYFARIEAKPPILQSEAEDVVTEALRSTRPHYRPVR